MGIRAHAAGSRYVAKYDRPWVFGFYHLKTILFYEIVVVVVHQNVYRRGLNLAELAIYL